LSTPVIDPNPGADGFATIYVAGAVGPTVITAHEVHALSAKDGSERPGWPVNASMIKAAAAQLAGFTFDLRASNQRSALSLVNGILYVAYGGHYADCGGYHGWVVAISTADPTKTGAWATAGAGEAIWAAGGMASDGNGVIAVTGNSHAGGAVHLDGEEVVRITGLGTLTRNSANTFYPTGPNPANPLWRSMDGSDLDFGSNSPVVLQVGGTNYVAAVSKNGHFFLLNAANFGGTDTNNVPPGGAYLKVSADGMQIHTALAAYTSPTGAHVTFSANAAAGCPKGGGTSIMSILVPTGAPPALSVAWCVGMAGSRTAPIATTSDGKGADAIVWFIDNGSNLVGVDGDTGTSVVPATGGCSAVRQWTSPIAARGRIIAGGDGHLCSWSPH
jgi:hypothetical protein